MKEFIPYFINAGIAILTSLVTWFLTKRKYNVDVDSTEIQNLRKSLDFYEQIVKDYNKNLQFYIQLSENTRIEVYRLKEVLHRILNNACLDDKCAQRILFKEDEIKEILIGIQNSKSNGTIIEKKSS